MFTRGLVRVIHVGTRIFAYDSRKVTTSVLVSVLIQVKKLVIISEKSDFLERDNANINSFVRCLFICLFVCLLVFVSNQENIEQISSHDLLPNTPFLLPLLFLSSR